MSPDQLSALVDALRARGVQLRVEGDALRFRSPRGVLSEDERRLLSEHKPAVLALLRATSGSGQQGAVPTSQPAGAQQTEGEASPVSPSQQFVLAQELRTPGRPYFNVPFAMRLTGRLELTALQRALDRLVERHEALRMRFSKDAAGRDVQSPAPPMPCPLITVDAAVDTVVDAAVDSRAQAAGARAASERLATEEARRPFDLLTPPLIRAAVYHVSADEHLLLLNLHHIISDGQSVAIMWRDLAALYQAERTGVPARLPPLRTRFTDYVNRLLTPEYAKESARHVEYFRERLADVPVLRLPIEFPRLPVRRLHSGTCVQEIPAASYRALHALAQQAQTTVFTALLASLAALFVRWTGQELFCLGIAIAGREQAAEQDVVGCFTNTLALRICADGDPSFLVLLERLREEIASALEHWLAPLGAVTAALPMKAPSNVPVPFQSVVTFNRDAGVVWPEGTLLPVPISTGVARREFDLLVQEHDGRLLFMVRYDSDLFRPATVEAQALRLVRMVVAAAQDPHAPLSRLKLDPEGSTR